MRRLKAQIDNELSGVRVSPALKRRLLRAAEREARRQRRRHVLALSGSVAGIAAALVLVCGLALMTRGYRLVPGGGSGDPIQPLSPGQPAETGIPPLSHPNETPEILLPSADDRHTALPTEAAESLADRIHARLDALAEEQGVAIDEEQLRLAVDGLLAVARLEGGPDAWYAPIHQILADDLGLSEAFVAQNALVEEFIGELSRAIPAECTPEPSPAPTEIAEPTAEARQPIFREDTMNYSWLSGNVMQALFTIDGPDSASVSQLLRGATVEVAPPEDDSLFSAARKNAAYDGVNVLYQLIRSEATKDGVRVLFMAVLDQPGDEGLTLRIRDADGGVIAENLSLMGDSTIHIFSIGLRSYEEYGGVTDNGLSGDIRMGEGAVLLVPPMAILAVDLEESRIYCPSESGPVYYHASSLCANLGKGARSTLTPDDCESLGFAPCPVCMPEGEAPYAWEGWTMEGVPFNDCEVIPVEGGARLFGWTTMEAFVSHAQKIGGSGTLNMALSGQRGAGDMAYDRILLQFNSRMTAYGMQSARQFVSDAPTYEQFMGIQ